MTGALQEPDAEATLELRVEQAIDAVMESFRNLNACLDEKRRFCRTGLPLRRCAHHRGVPTVEPGGSTRRCLCPESRIEEPPR